MELNWETIAQRWCLECANSNMVAAFDGVCKKCADGEDQYKVKPFFKHLKEPSGLTFCPTCTNTECPQCGKDSCVLWEGAD